MNTFDIAVSAIALIAIVMGFQSGFIRSMTMILGYVAAAPVAVSASSFVAKALGQGSAMASSDNSLVFGVIFVALGYVVGKLLCYVIDDVVGPVRSIPDRLAGATLGGTRVVLVAIMLVLVFDRIIPAGREPSYLVGSKLRPLLSQAGKSGLRTLPPETIAYIDRMKRG